ncbi:glycosyltransferase involved in cell wall biosynthesis [Methanofollis sp. W23]|uniref:glycosyltransferase family 4 protein n=1 Tax=Methanofollis sp. W23 TaxID=2817849 RepID=UPI001AE6B385|nr:glycosyltransferase family 4 protein [Methanofollis sp. W23]MBP2144601.1 glycosyltransferase involved in cell wall biosynthesis [Methanofollis sp. W23]
MKILIADPLDLSDPINGRQVHVYEIIRGLARSGHQVYVLSGQEPEFSGQGSITCLAIDDTNLTTMYASVVGALFRLFGAGQVDVIYSRTSLFGALSSSISRIFGAKPIVCEVNGFFADEIEFINKNRSSTTIKDRINLEICQKSERYLLGHAARVVAVTEGIKRLIVEGGLAEADRISVIENGANTDLFRPGDPADARAHMGLSQDFRYLCFVGNFAPWQGLQYIVQAVPAIVRAHPDCRVLLVGDGVMREDCTRMGEALGVSDYLIFYGPVPYTRVPACVQASDICIAPFVRERNAVIGLSPLKVYEYMACGRPVVASAIPGVSELLVRSGGGVLVRPEDPRALAEAVIRLLSSDDLRQTMGERAASYVRDHHTWANVAAQVSAVCEKAAAADLEVPVPTAALRSGAKTDDPR